MTDRFKGLLVPMLTPFDTSGAPDAQRALRFGKDLLSAGSSGLALFGTTSEGQSLAPQERMDLLDTLIEGGIPATQLMVGTGSCALTEAIQMTRHVAEQKCGGVLMLPPFFYKAVSDEGIFQFFSEVIHQVDNSDLRIYLYHIPPVAHVGFSVELVGKLVEAFPEQVVGLKNSSGDHSYSIALRERVPQFDVFCGSEDFLLETMRIGGVGCISATGNANPKGIFHLYQNVDTPEAELLQTEISAIRGAFQKFPVIPALKAFVAQAYDDPQWTNVRPPLVELPSTDTGSLLAELDKRNHKPNDLFR